jgi:phosphohistidine phosphatase
MLMPRTPGPQGDFARELTKKGRKQAERMADWLRPRLEGKWTVLSSPAARAVQTVTPLGIDYEIRTGLGCVRQRRGHAARGGLARRRQGDRGRAPADSRRSRRAPHRSPGDISVRKGSIHWFVTRERDGRTETLLKAVLDPETLAEG